MTVEQAWGEAAKAVNARAENIIFGMELKYEPGCSLVRLFGFKGPYGTVATCEPTKEGTFLVTASFDPQEVFSFTSRLLEKQIASKRILSPCCKKTLKISFEGVSCSKCGNFWKL